MNEPSPMEPHEAGVPEEQPDQSHIEGAELLANEARKYLTGQGFTDEEINEWALTYITENGSGDVESLIRWIEKKEDDS